MCRCLSTHRTERETPFLWQSVRDQRLHVVAGELVAAVQEGELDHEEEADDLAAELLDELRLRLRGAAGGEHVVVDDHPSSRRDRVRVHVEAVLAVLQVVRRLDRVPRQLPRLSSGDEAAAETVRERAAEDEAPPL